MKSRITLLVIAIALFAGIVYAKDLKESTAGTFNVKAQLVFSDAAGITNTNGLDMNKLKITSVTLATGTTEAVITDAMLTTSSRIIVTPMGPFTGFSTAPTITVARNTGSATITITATGTRTVTVPLAVLISNP